MFELQNKTGHPARLFPGMNPNGGECVVALVKGTFALNSGGALTPVAEPVPIVEGDVPFGEPGQSSLRYANDLVPEKKGTDVVLIGHAQAPGGHEATELDVTLQ